MSCPECGTTPCQCGKHGKAWNLDCLDDAQLRRALNDSLMVTKTLEPMEMKSEQEFIKACLTEIARRGAQAPKDTNEKHN